MPSEEVETQLRELLTEAKVLGLNLDEDRARETIQGLVAQAQEHGVSVAKVKQRNLMRELFGGGTKPE